jgi:hypothetical protein
VCPSAGKQRRPDQAQLRGWSPKWGRENGPPATLSEATPGVNANAHKVFAICE